MSTQENMLDASMRPDHTETREVGQVAGKRFKIEPWSATAWSVHQWQAGFWVHLGTYRTRREAEENAR